jgi:hypothetical protein
VPNPFRFAAPVDGEQFTGRRREITEVLARMTDGINAAVISPRRYGKTSLVNEACARAARKGASIARLNAMSANDDLGGFASRFVSAVYAAGGPWHRTKDSLGTFINSIGQFRPAVTLSTDGTTSFTFTGESMRRDPSALIGRAYELMAGSRTPVVFVDEFQETVRMPGNVPGLFKSLADQHPNVSLVVAGSKEHMMRDLTTDSRGALYGMMHMVYLQPIPAAEMGDYVHRRFNVGGKPISRELADRITDYAGPVPNDIQHLGYDVYAAVESAREVLAEDVEEGLRAAIDQEADGFFDTFARMTGNQRRVLIALAVEPTATPQSGQFLARTRYANPSGVRRAIAGLEEADLIALRDGEWTVVNPFLRRWLAERD